ncbi:arylamine N-acetyltransferase [Mycobacterium sp. 1274761.0]|uniref:arylamine N-acetyltransferase family protein n=1 Tax=Mycobacterium sp. 1274761.0 TaxID=1834077 RepID=UPI0007FC24DC|nr:arylamine N-acetyltransferase [Mycobacterium sp. 1274761.0]OBK74694.1 arylamine N-acetyltransferase [Mycobacterium sp. 1274761.0]
MSIAAYLQRVSYTGPTDPTLELLEELVAAHNRTIPFENLDPLMGVPVVDLRPETLVDKLVHRRRGGYCFEQNGVMAYVLSRLGFGVDVLGGRVVWMNTSGELPAQTHQALAVAVPGDDARYLVDVGFGGQTLTSPIRLETDTVQQTRHEPYRIRSHDDGLILESEIRGKWEPLYLFSTRPFPMIDRQVGSWYVSTYPQSGFVTGLSVALITDDARWNLRGRNLAIHGKSGSERIVFDTAAQVVDALTDRLGIELTGLGDVEARVNEVLDR